MSARQSVLIPEGMSVEAALDALAALDAFDGARGAVPASQTPWPPRTRALTAVERTELGVALHERRRRLEVAGLGDTAGVLDALMRELERVRIEVE